MRDTLSIEVYRDALAEFFRVFVFDPSSLLDIRTLVWFWIPGVIFLGLAVVGLFRLRAPVLPVRQGLVLMGVACALWGIHFASGVLFLYAREASRAGPVEVEDYLPWAIGVAYMVRGCVLLVLASVAVGLNFLFGGRRRGEGGGGKEG